MKSPVFVLGINAAFHESSACLLRDGEVVAAVEEERFNRIKHAKIASIEDADQLPWQSIRYCLQTAGIELKNVAHVGYSFEPRQRFAKNAENHYSYAPDTDNYGTPEGERRFREKVSSSEQQLNAEGFAGRFYFLRHHDCHAASAFLVSPFEEAGVMVMDGIGEYDTTTLYRGKGTKLERIFESEYPHSVGFLWEKVGKFIGFSQYDACKVMGLAAYGDPKVYAEQLRTIAKDGPGFAVDDELARFRCEEDYEQFEKIFGFQKKTHQPENIKPRRRTDEDNSAIANVAAALQELTERTILSFVEKFKDLGLENVCMAGGVALNCAANGLILKKGWFKELFVQPASNDAGTAVGAAFIVWNQILANPRTYVFNSPYLGPEFTDAEIRAALDRRGLNYTETAQLEKDVAALIAEGEIVAWFDGRMEIGPRALGHRSLLADPRRADIREVLNTKVKHRELFRPFCPSVLKEHAAEWFNVSNMSLSPASPLNYMLAAVDVRPSRRSLIPSVVHIDGTCRIQTVDEETNPRYWKLLREFEQLTKVPILLNTSFNDSEPIVCTPDDAISTFLKTSIDHLALGQFLVSKKNNAQAAPKQADHPDRRRAADRPR